MVKLFELTCPKCSHNWKHVIEDGKRIGEPQWWDFSVNRGKVCENRKGYGTCAPIACPMCGYEGSHDIQALS